MRKLEKAPEKTQIYFWNMLGSIGNALASVLFLAIVTRFLGNKESDTFSLGWAIAQMMLTIGTFQVRLFQATDVFGKYNFKQYLFFRYVTISIMILISGIYIIFNGYSRQKAVIIGALCLFRATDALSDVYQGHFQQKERLDLAGKSLFCKTMISFGVFGSVLIYTKSLFFSCLSMLMISIVSLFLFEFRYIKVSSVRVDIQKKDHFEKGWFTGLFVTCLPLFLNSYLIMSIFNSPKLAIDQAISQGNLPNGMQTIYNIIFMPTSVINLAYIIFRPIITKMAIEWNKGRVNEYLNLIKQLMLKLFVINVVILMGGYLLGIPVLSAIYGIDLKNMKIPLMILLFAGGINTMVNLLDNALTVIRKQYVLIVAYIATWLIADDVSVFFVEKMEITGASIGFLVIMCILLGSVCALFGMSLMNAKKSMKNNNEVNTK